MRVIFNESRVRDAIADIFARIKRGEGKKQAMSEVLLLHEFDMQLARKVVEGVERKLTELAKESEPAKAPKEETKPPHRHSPKPFVNYNH